MLISAAVALAVVADDMLEAVGPQGAGNGRPNTETVEQGV
jgi:hypothetical protein